MSSKQIWYVLLPQYKKFAGPFDTNGILSLLNLGRIKIDSYVWSPQSPNDRWKMLIEFNIFKQILTRPNILFSLSEEEYLKMYRLVNNTSDNAEGRATWFESHILNEIGTPDLNTKDTEPLTVPIPRRSTRVNLKQTIYAKISGQVRTAEGFVLSKNGVYFKVKNPVEFPVGSKLGLATMYKDTDKTINLSGIITCEDECHAGKNVGIRFVNLDERKQAIINNWVESIAVS